MLRRKHLRLVPAAQAVFDTYELLEMIIALLPSGDIDSCRGVGTIWKQLVQQSKPIRRSRALSPLRGFYSALNTSSIWFDTSRRDMPTYDGKAGIRVHPVLAGSPGYRQKNEQRTDMFTDTTEVRRFTYRFDLPESWEGGRLQEALQDFATCPPLQTMAVVVRFYCPNAESFTSTTACFLRIDEGIKIDHLLQVKASLEQTYALSLPASALPIDVFAEFATISPSTNTRHLRSWSEKSLRYGTGKTRQEIAEDDSRLQSTDGTAEDRYIRDCMRKEGWEEEDVGYLFEYFARKNPDMRPIGISNVYSEDEEVSSVDSGSETDSSEASDKDSDERDSKEGFSDDSTDEEGSDEESSDEEDDYDEHEGDAEEDDLGDYDQNQYRNGLSDDDY
ncbi:hypothetical protein LTR85_009522 [Meristemomyces frigidus]|nr:hypothetical protein LTR85_009522 [Meristemomyces frigidus]